jgi:hypothetical protein
MIAGYAVEGESRYLSARVKRLQPEAHPIAAAMQRVMQAVSVSRHRERVTGEIEPRPRFPQSWIAARGYDPTLPPQVAFDRVADREPDRFRGGSDPRSISVLLVHSIAQLNKSAVEVEIAYDEKSDFVQQATKLGRYWSRPQELFARAFESFIEDELAQRGWCSPYLVFGTQRDYKACRGLPYPTGTERERIAVALRDLLTAFASEGEGNSPRVASIR